MSSAGYPIFYIREKKICSFKMLFSSILVSALVLLVEVEGEYFRIQHKLSKGFLGIYPGGWYDPVMIVGSGDNDYPWSDVFIDWYFEQVDDEWGYIRNKDYASRIVFPLNQVDNDWGCSMTPEDNSGLLLQENGHPCCRFALDQINNRIIHHGGKYFHVYEDHAEPDIPTGIVVNGGVNEYMEFELTNPNNPNEIVYPYGDATISGDWMLVFSVENPLATHTYTVETKIGKSATGSTNTEFKFVWEGSAGAQAYFAQMSTSASLSDEILLSSSQTWMEEITETYSITVVAGQSVATWQKHFYGEQHGHKATHQSNMFMDTEGPDIKPGDVKDGYYSI